MAGIATLGRMKNRGERLALATMGQAHVERSLWMMFLIAACFAGVFLGLKYDFLVVIPVTIVVASVYFASSLTNGLSISTTLMNIVIPSISLQAGYMLGLTSRELVNQVWATIVSSSGNEYR
jgi:hypothetical protein